MIFGWKFNMGFKFYGSFFLNGALPSFSGWFSLHGFFFSPIFLWDSWDGIVVICVIIYVIWVLPLKFSNLQQIGVSEIFWFSLCIFVLWVLVHGARRDREKFESWCVFLCVVLMFSWEILLHLISIQDALLVKCQVHHKFCRHNLVGFLTVFGWWMVWMVIIVCCTPWSSGTVWFSSITIIVMMMLLLVSFGFCLFYGSLNAFKF